MEEAPGKENYLAMADSEAITEVETSLPHLREGIRDFWGLIFKSPARKMGIEGACRGIGRLKRRREVIDRDEEAEAEE
ncbi:unnamed protein product [Linum trigynum]|uniref:Uncharacterized protein n=1 Tax=Linum trigynum TaxID=586398 RepID=A0AAV2CA16_9ROSI